jgi:L-iditol 2-dehydrogenase
MSNGTAPTNGSQVTILQPTTTIPLPRPNPGLWTTKDHRIYNAPSPELQIGPEDCIVHMRVNGICGYDSSVPLL